MTQNTLLSLSVLLIALPVASAQEDLIFAKDSAWEMVSEGHEFAEGMAWDAAGHFYFTDVPNRELFKINKENGEQTLVVAATGRANGIALGPDGRLYGCAAESDGINAWDVNTWEVQTYGLGAKSNDLAILDDGTVFFTDPSTGSVWRLNIETNERTEAVSTDFRPNGIALSLDQRTLFVADFNSDTIYAHSIDNKGQVVGGASVAFQLAVRSDGRGLLDGMQILPDGRLLIGTSLGIQLAVPAGQESESRRIVIVPHPADRPRCNYVRVSPDGQWIYASFVSDIRRRLINPDLLP